MDVLLKRFSIISKAYCNVCGKGNWEVLSYSTFIAEFRIHVMEPIVFD